MQLKRGMELYSVIDIGSNTIRLAVYRVDGEGITGMSQMPFMPRPEM